MWTSYGNKSKNCILKSARRSLAIVRKCQERLETLCAIEEREKIKIKMKRICIKSVAHRRVKNLAHLDKRETMDQY